MLTSFSLSSAGDSVYLFSGDAATNTPEGTAPQKKVFPIDVANGEMKPIQATFN